MKIIKEYDHHRRDFWADMECETCGHVEKNISCYDDSNFHQNVIPNIPCKKCGCKSGEVTSSAKIPAWVVM